MSALGNAASTNGLLSALLKTAEPYMAAEVWAFYRSHANDRIVSWLGPASPRVSALRWFIEGIAGPEPITPAIELPPVGVTP